MQIKHFFIICFLRYSHGKKYKEWTALFIGLLEKKPTRDVFNEFIGVISHRFLADQNVRTVSVIL